MIKVTVDMKKGVYLVYDGEDQFVTKPMEHQYDKKRVKKKRDAIEKTRRWIPAEKKNLIDVGLYEAIQEFDRQYGTEYAEKYIDTTIMQIPFSSRAESSRQRYIRSRETRAAEFQKAGISVEYNVSLFGGWGSLSFNDRMQAIRLAFAQRQNGVKVNTFTGKQPLLVAPEVKVVEKMEDLPGMGKTEPEPEPVQPDPLVQPEQVAQPELVVEPEPEPALQPEVVVPPVQAEPKRIVLELEEDDLPPMPDEDALKKMQEEDEKARLAKEAKEAEARRIEEAKRAKAAKKAQPKPKRTVKRCKAKQQAINEQREAGRLQNRYTGMIQAKAEKKARREAAVGQAKKEPKKPPVQQTTTTKKKKPVAKTVVLAKNGSKAQKEGLVTRFTRKLKDKADAIRNKVHVPQLTKKQKAIAGAATAFALAGALALGGYTLLSNGNAQDLRNEQTPTRPTATETVKPEQLGNIQQGNIILDETPTPTQTPVVSQTPEVKAPEEVEQNEGKGQTGEQNVQQVEEGEKDEKVEYLSSIRVGTAMSISSGKFFASPEGQGNFGRFENYVEGVKEINMIDVMTDTQYITIKDPNISLYELKQQYPNAKFSYHIVCRNADGTTTVLGWLTEESFEQNKDQEVQEEQAIQNAVDLDFEEER